jgi:sec-independent protein translocase protein TatB
VFNNLNWWEIISLALLGLFIFGPERLPKVIADGVRMLRNLREMARNATTDLSRELGTEVRLEDLHPKTFIRKHLLSEEEEQQLRRPFDDMFQDVKQITADANDYVSRPPAPRSYDSPYDPAATSHNYEQVRPYDGQPHPYEPELPGPEPRRYDSDAT